MTQLAARTRTIAPSATLAMTARAKAMKAQGINVLTMSAGEPDFDTPAKIKDAAVQSLARGETKYTPVEGTPALRKAIATRVNATYGTHATMENVIVGTGGKQVLFNACAALLDPHDEAVFGAPYWVSYVDMVRFCGATPVIVEADDRHGFLPKAADLEAVITPRTKLLILNSPSNPTGAVYRRNELADIAAMLRRHPHVFTITDDIYEALVYDGEFASLLQAAPDLADRVLIASGVSKSYAMTGWRIGYGVGPKFLIEAMSNIQGASTSGASCVAQAAALEAMAGDQAPVHAMVKVFHQRRDRIVAAIRHIPDVTLAAPAGAFYVFPRVDAYFNDKVPDSLALCEFLLEHAHLATVPGSAFGMEGYIRLSFACSDADIDEAVKRMAHGLKLLRS